MNTPGLRQRRMFLTSIVLPVFMFLTSAQPAETARPSRTSPDGNREDRSKAPGEPSSNSPVSGRAALSLPPEFARLPVLYGGRLKPLSSAAKETLLEFSGRSTSGTFSPLAWFAGTLFAPKTVESIPVFLIDDPALAQALGIHTVKRERYSFSTLRPALRDLDRLYTAAAHAHHGESSRIDAQVLALHRKLTVFFTLSTRVEPVAGCEGAWSAVGQAFRAGDRDAFERAVSAYAARSAQELPPGTWRRVAGEALMNRLRPLARAEMCYAFAILLWLGARLGARRLTSAAAAMGFLGFLGHSLGIAARMWIMHRPPVTNLYSTFVFVGWVCVLLGLVIYRIRDREMGALSAGLGGFLLLFISGKYAADGDTMGVMTAVLNSNFWLASHVLTITIGYAGCCVAGLVGHFHLIRTWRGPGNGPELRESYRTLVAVLGFGLAFTCIGTVFGGIWADQSWGRFWGWDPKENGALLIVLWCATLFHARHAGVIGRTGVAVGTIFGIQLVLLAWFGINMLGIGLHAYGRVSSRGAVLGLATFCAAETVFVYVMVLLIRRRALIETRTCTCALQSNEKNKPSAP